MRVAWCFWTQLSDVPGLATGPGKEVSVRQKMYPEKAFERNLRLESVVAIVWPAKAGLG